MIPNQTGVTRYRVDHRPVLLGERPDGTWVIIMAYNTVTEAVVAAVELSPKSKNGSPDIPTGAFNVDGTVARRRRRRR